MLFSTRQLFAVCPRAHGKGPLYRRLFVVCCLPCATHGKAGKGFAVCKKAFAVCFWHTANSRPPVVHVKHVGLVGIEVIYCYFVTSKLFEHVSREAMDL